MQQRGCHGAGEGGERGGCWSNSSKGGGVENEEAEEGGQVVAGDLAQHVRLSEANVVSEDDVGPGGSRADVEFNVGRSLLPSAFLRWTRGCTCNLFNGGRSKYVLRAVGLVDDQRAMAERWQLTEHDSSGQIGGCAAESIGEWKPVQQRRPRALLDCHYRGVCVGNQRFQ